MKRKMTHKPTGLTFGVEQCLDGEKRLFITLSGNSYTTVDLKPKQLESLSHFLWKLFVQLEEWEE